MAEASEDEKSMIEKLSKKHSSKKHDIRYLCYK
jgi:hypothetical protein